VVVNQVTKLAWRPLAVLASAQALLVLDNSLGGVSTPSIVGSLGVDINAVQAVLTLSALVIAACLLTAGKLGDVIGRRTALLVGLSIRVVGSGLAALAPNLALFGLGEAVLESIGGALATTAAAALIAETFVGAGRVRAYAMVGVFCASAMALGPVVGGWVIGVWTWRAVFALEACLALLLIPLSLLWVKGGQRSEAPERLDVVGATLSGLGLVLVVLGMQQSANSGWWFAYRDAPSWWGLSPVVFIIAAGIGVLTLFVRWEAFAKRVGKPTLFDTDLVRLAPLRATFLTGIAGQAAATGMYFIYPLFLLLVVGLSPQMVGLLLAPAALTACAVSILWPRLTRRLSPRRVVRLGAVSLAAAGLLALIQVSPGIGRIPISVSAALLGCGLGLLGAQLPATAQGLVEDSRRSETAGLLGTAQNLGAAIGFAVVGSVLVIGLSAGVRQFVVEEPSLSTNTRAVAEVAVERGVPFLPAETARQRLIAKGVARGEIDRAVAGYETSQQRALGAASLLIVGLGVAAWLLARRMPSQVPAS